MSQLSNAPLIELVFRIRWHLRTPGEYLKIKYLLGDFFYQIKDLYPKRAMINKNEVSAETQLDSVLYQFSQKDIDYPHIQLGNNIMAITCSDDYYYWEDFEERTFVVTSKLINILRDLIGPDHYHLYLDYFDFYPLDFQKNNILDFLKKEMKISFYQKFHETSNHPNSFDLAFEYPVDLGYLSTSINMAQYNDKEGILVKTGAESNTIEPDLNKIKDWIRDAHDLCSKSFKKMTEGNLYNSFQ